MVRVLKRDVLARPNVLLRTRVARFCFFLLPFIFFPPPSGLVDSSLGLSKQAANKLPANGVCESTNGQFSV